MSAHIHIVIGVCTFRRPMVVETIASLMRQDLPADVTAEIIIADNDETPSAQTAVLAAAKGGPLGLFYLHAPARNISVARNAVVEAATARGAQWLAFADDDERLDAGWIKALWQVAASTGAGVVLGDVRGVYAADAPAWMRQNGVHDTRPERDGKGRLMGGYTCNVLMNLRDPAILGLRFDPERGRTGGEDTAFFAGARANGALFAHAPDAVAEEDVPPARATLGWLLQRRMRMGQTHASLIGREVGPLRRTALTLVAMAKVAACAVMAMAFLPRPLARNRAIMRGALHFGTVSGLVGARSINPYGAISAPPVSGGSPPQEAAR